ncbi:hypothetical protein ACSBOB_21240 [Mesorhizobium sp. ASY16-5R]|uniref:hypothetical protein n=1 Tax=Mesorhizobium sp. ASY16-5R TaxID=3445772 RepID=UPI003F9EFE4D
MDAAPIGQPVIRTNTVKRCLFGLRAFCEWPKDNGCLDRNPVEDMVLMKAKKKSVFTTSQTNTLFKSLANRAFVHLDPKQDFDLVLGIDTAPPHHQPARGLQPRPHR